MSWLTTCGSAISIDFLSNKCPREFQGCQTYRVSPFARRSNWGDWNWPDPGTPRRPLHRTQVTRANQWHTPATGAVRGASEGRRRTLRAR